MTPGAEHYLYTMFDMAAKGYIDPKTFKAPERQSDRMLAYRCFDSAFDHALGLVIDLDFLQRYAGPDRPTFVKDALPSISWLMSEYDKEERKGRIHFLEGGQKVSLEQMKARFES